MHIVNTLFRPWVNGDAGQGLASYQHTTVVSGSSSSSSSGFTGMDEDLLNEGNEPTNHQPLTTNHLPIPDLTTNQLQT